MLMHTVAVVHRGDGRMLMSAAHLGIALGVNVDICNLEACLVVFMGNF